MSSPSTPDLLDVKAVDALETIARALKDIARALERANDLRRDLSNTPETPRRQQ
jgi:hypothetical protein